MVDILMRRRQNNPILTGEAGVGKTAVVEGFALRIAAGDVPPQLKDVELRTLDVGLLQAGASMKGEFENRLRQVIEEVQASPEADHPVHRRGAHPGRRRRRRRHRRCRQPAEAGAGARHPAHRRRHHLGRIQEAHREGPGADPPLPGRAGRRAERGEGHPDDARRRLDDGEAPPGADPRRGAGGGGQAVAPLHSGAPVARQVGQPARHRLRARRDQPARGAAEVDDSRRRIEALETELADHRPREGRRRRRRPSAKPAPARSWPRRRHGCEKLDADWQAEKALVDQILRHPRQAARRRRAGGRHRQRAGSRGQCRKRVRRAGRARRPKSTTRSALRRWRTEATCRPSSPSCRARRPLILPTVD